MTEFGGFPKQTVVFYENLLKNNSKEWFEKHRDDYKSSVIEPAQQFVLAMGDRLKILSPAVCADTRINGSGSIFRIYRDTRFSKDKSPYKTYLGILFWEGRRKKTENSGYYFHLEPPKLMLGVGVYMFTKSPLKLYRDAVVHQEYGLTLREAVEGVNAVEKYTLGGKHYKRVPRGYDANHRNAEFLLYNGLHVGIETAIPDELYSGALIDYCFDRFRDMAPVHHWLVSVLDSA
jgi:uncharacterized protein (TIGR02453 family)